MKVLIGEIRRGRGIRPDGVVDFLVAHCAVDLPVRDAQLDTVAPVLSLVLSVGHRPTVLGTSLSLMPPQASSSARALLDALSSAERPHETEANEFRVMVGPGEDWSLLRRAFDGMPLPLVFTPARPRSWREVTTIIGDRPAGLKLKPDITCRPATGRVTRVPQGGSPVSLEEAEEAVRDKLRRVFGGSREALLDGERSKALAARLRRLLDCETIRSVTPGPAPDRSDVHGDPPSSEPSRPG